MLPRSLIALVVVASGWLLAQNPTFPNKGPLSPREEQASFQIEKGFVIELVASEPAVVDPVALAFDDMGRLLVAEMHAYPNDGVGTGVVQSGKIKLLEDADRDGYFEKSTVFAEGLRLPNSVMPYNGGVLVSNAPDLIFLKDTEGDGKADEKRILYTGFDLANIQQLLNGLQWGLDNWVYALGGSKGGNIKSVENAEAPEVPLRGRGIRFHPNRPGSLEPISGGGQFGLAPDAWGNWFVNTNSQHLRQIVLFDHYLRRNPDLAVPQTTIDISDHGPACKVHRLSPFESWRVERTMRRKGSDDSKRFATTELVPGGFVTSGCSPIIYHADLFPANYRNNTFICDPANNLIHRDVLFSEGVPFTAKRGDADREFLASTDNWFRPVYLCQGPDGAIYVADFYREVIETPLSLPEDIKKGVNLQSQKRGRIWRIRPVGDYKPRPVNLAKESSAELVKHLNDANRWWRINAQRLLVERQDMSVVPTLEALARDSDFGPGIVHALWTLHGLKSLHPKWAIRLTQDPEEKIRVQALRLAEEYLKAIPEEGDPSFDVQVFKDLAADPSPKVRFQAAFSLREFPTHLFKILSRDIDDPWIPTAVLTSLDTPGKALAQLTLLAVEMKKNPKAGAGHVNLMTKLGFLVSLRGSESDLGVAFAALPLLERHAPLQVALLEGLGQGLQNRQLSLDKILQRPELRLAGRIYQSVIDKAAEDLKNEKTPLTERTAALRLLAFAPLGQASEALQSFLSPQQPQELQKAAVKTLGQHQGAQVAEILLKEWGSFSPSLRRDVLDVVLARKERVQVLLKALADKKVNAGQLESSKLDLLRKYPDAGIRAEAVKLLAGIGTASRQKVVESYQSALELAADPVRGKAIFKKTCAICHKLEGEGVEVGADLQAALPNKTTQQLLLDILDPSREVDARFLDYIVTTQAGKVLTGIIAAETASSVTLRRAEKTEDTILRNQIESIQATSKSLMPEGLEMQLPPQDFADLVGYLRELGGKK